MKTVQVVEDEEELLEIVSSVLSEEGYEVEKASSAEEALSSYSIKLPDLIICDVKLGKMDGFSLLERLKGTPNLSHIPFMFLTSFDGSEAKKKGLGLGADAYMTKPFDLDELLELIKKLAPS